MPVEKGIYRNCTVYRKSHKQQAHVVIWRYLQVGEVGKDGIQIARRRWIQREKLPLGSPDVCSTVYLRKQQLGPSTHMYKATASTVIATGNLRQGRLMAGHGGLYSTTKLRQIEAEGG